MCRTLISGPAGVGFLRARPRLGAARASAARRRAASRPGLSVRRASGAAMAARAAMMRVYEPTRATSCCDLLDERRLVVALELGPGRERARVGAVDEDLAVEVIDLVLVGAGLEAVHDLVDRVAVAVPGLDADVDVALHHAAQVRARCRQPS